MTTNLSNEPEVVDTSLDGVVIRNYIDGLPGGASLDVTGYTPTVIKAGHIVIRETATGVHKVMPVTADGTAYAAKPDGHEYRGVVSATRLASKPMCPVMLRGTVNEVASPYPVTAEMKTALPHILFTQD
ncbi:hypothetical protein [Alistipes sp.]|uniref:hypothetical protein n=1 Tax=Alistipes sp. TaxID=1872444 RepID=UPI0035285199